MPRANVHNIKLNPGWDDIDISTHNEGIQVDISTNPENTVFISVYNGNQNEAIHQFHIKADGTLVQGIGDM